MITDHEESLLISEIDALSLQLADALLLRREPDNVHDELAIVVLTVTAQKLGYLARVTSITRSFSSQLPVRLFFKAVRKIETIYSKK